MQRREFLGFLVGVGCAMAASSAAAQTVATLLSNEAVPEGPISDFSSKRGGGGRSGGRGRGRGGGMGRFFGRGRGGCPPGLRKQGRC